MVNFIRRNIWLIVFMLMLLALVAMGSVLVYSMLPEQEEETKVGAILISSKNDQGWSQAHYEGLVTACASVDKELIVVENVQETPESAGPAIESLIDQGCRVIFLTSDGFGDNMLPIVNAHPKVVFYTISNEANADNMTTYYGRMYQMRYLCGMIAGSVTKTNVLGFVAGMDSIQAKRAVNAYLLGARSVNPEAVVKMCFTDTWTGRSEDKKAARFLVKEQGADVLAYHSSFSYTVEAAEEMGVYSIGYISVNEKHSPLFLTAPVFHWDVLYEKILQDCIRGNANSIKYYWWGAPKGLVSLAPYSVLVDKNTRSLVENTMRNYDEGWDVFAGEIRRNDGFLMCRPDERIGDTGLLYHMDWLVEGVEVYEE